MSAATAGRGLVGIAVALAGVLVALVGALPGPASAEQRRLGPGGDLAGALASLGPGDTLILAPGVHRLDVDVDVTGRGLPDRPITVRGEGGADGVEIAGTGRLALSSVSRWVIEGVTFRTVPLLLTSDDDLGHPFDTSIVANRFIGRGLKLENASSVEIDGNRFVDVRSRQPGEDRHAIELLGTSGDLVIRANTVTDAGADAIHAAGRTDNVLVEGNELRIARPRPGGDRFCNTGENAIDVRNGDRWVVRENVVAGYQVVPGCDVHDSATPGGDAVAFHEYGGRDVEVTANRFVDNTVHLLVIGRTCESDGGTCTGEVRTERVEVRDNEFRSGDVPGRTTGVRITPGAGTAQLDPPVAPVDVTVADNRFVGIDLVVDVVARTFDSGGAEVATRPGDVVVERNSYAGGRMKLAAPARVTERDNVAGGTEPPTGSTAQQPATTTTVAAADSVPTSTASTPSGPGPSAAPTTGPIGEPDLEQGFPWGWLAGTALLIFAVAVGVAAARARRGAAAGGRAGGTGYGPGDG